MILKHLVPTFSFSYRDQTAGAPPPCEDLGPDDRNDTATPNSFKLLEGLVNLQTTAEVLNCLVQTHKTISTTKYCIVTEGNLASTNIQSIEEDKDGGAAIKPCRKRF